MYAKIGYGRNITVLKVEIKVQTVEKSNKRPRRFDKQSHNSQAA